MRKERIASRRLITNSDTATLTSDGSHVVTAENAVEVTTPFSVKVIFEDEGQLVGKSIDKWPGQFPLDREVIKYLYKRNISEMAR